VLYLTARPDWLHRRTHEWLAAHGYPDGIVQTTLSYPPKVGSSAAEFKTDALLALLDRFPGAVEYGIGNADTDVEAYGAVGIAPERAYFYQFDPGAEGVRVDDYATLIPTARALPSLCE
jgi:phosphatidate phosphatase PAH1